MDAEFTLIRAGTRLIALGERALYWPAGRALLLADLHLGKADVFRRAGIAVPRGGTAHDLQRVQGLITRYDCRQLWILGDIVHGPIQAAEWLTQWQAWRAAHAQLAVHLIRGNHDRAAAIDALHVTVHDHSQSLGPFRLAHEPDAVAAADDTAHLLCGHLHPQASLAGLRRRWPAFWLRPGLTVLPAFSHFTAGMTPTMECGDQLLACVEGAIIPLPVVR